MLSIMPVFFITTGRRRRANEAAVTCKLGTQFCAVKIKVRLKKIELGRLRPATRAETIFAIETSQLWVNFAFF